MVRIQVRFRRLLAALREPALEVPGGRVFRPRAPIELQRALGRTVGRHVWMERTQPLVEFRWQGAARPRSSLRVLELGTTAALICLNTPRPRVIAAVVGCHREWAVSAWFVHLLKGNGATYGIELFRILPAAIENHRPDWLPRPFVACGIRAWMAWADRSGVSPWAVPSENSPARAGLPSEAQHASSARGARLRRYLAACYSEPMTWHLGGAPSVGPTGGRQR